MAMDTDPILKMILKDIQELQGRLFDHHPFVSGEINYFQKEFEGKRKEDDVDGLFQILDRVVDTRETQLDRAISLAEPDLQIVKDNLNTAVENCDKILNTETVIEEDDAAERRLSLQKEWEAIANKYAKMEDEITISFNEKAKEIINQYLDLEKKLHIDK